MVGTSLSGKLANDSVDQKLLNRTDKRWVQYLLVIGMLTIALVALGTVLIGGVAGESVSDGNQATASPPDPIIIADGATVTDSDTNTSEAADFTVTDLSPSSFEHPDDQEWANYTINGTITNPGDTTASESVTFAWDGTVTETRDITLDGGEETTVSFEITETVESHGEYHYEIATETDSLVGTMDVVIVNPGRMTISSPTAGDEYARGDIVPIELELDEGNIGTLTFGDLDGHGVEIDVTVEDTDSSGSATVYLNTFQVGHGYLAADGDEYEPNFNTSAFSSRNHGFFTLEGSGSALVGTDGKTAIAHPDTELMGGSQGGSVLPAFAYDLSSVAGTKPFTEADRLDDRRQLVLTERDEESLSVFTAPATGPNAIDPETIDDIETAIDDGRITPAGGQIVDGQYAVMELETEGLTGVFHDAIVANDSVEIDAGVLLDGETDEVTDLWRTASSNQILPWSAALVEPSAGSSARIALHQDGVFANSNDAGHLETFYLPLVLEEGEEVVTTDSWELTPPQDLEAIFEYIPPSDVDGMGDFVGEGVVQDVTFESPFADIDPAMHAYDPVNNTLEVSAEPDYDLHGVTNLAAGTDLIVKTAPGSTFSLGPQEIQVEDDPDRDSQVWTVENLHHFEDKDPGTTFSIEILFEYDSIQVDDIDGVVIEERTLETLAFSSQASTGDSIHVDELEVSHGGEAVLTDTDGTELGRTSDVPSGESVQDLSVPLEDALDSGTHEVSLTVYSPAGSPYPDSTRTATVWVGDDPDDAALVVLTDSLEPVSTSVESPGESFEVSASVINVADESESQSVELLLDESSIDSQDVTLSPDEQTDVTFTVETDDLEADTTATYAIDTAVSSESGTVTVEAADDQEEDIPEDDTATDDEDPAETDEDDDTDADDDGAGFGVVVAAVAILGATLYTVRARQSH